MCFAANLRSESNTYSKAKMTSYLLNTWIMSQSDEWNHTYQRLKSFSLQLNEWTLWGLNRNITEVRIQHFFKFFIEPESDAFRRHSADWTDVDAEQIVVHLFVMNDENNKMFVVTMIQSQSAESDGVFLIFLFDTVQKMKRV